MSITEGILMALIALSLVYIVYDSVVIPMLKGKTILTVPLKKRNLADQLIFAGLLVILVVSNIMSGGNEMVTYLLAGYAAIILYFVLLRTPKARFKEKGYFYGNFYSNYDRIKNMNLSEDGILVIETNRQRQLLHVADMEDLEKVLKVYTEH
ncbi:hypothetical protein CU633_16410 [Bacillus sp. V3-13]|uniref:DUF986 family protein n=1 Tax=Bacillus sp. V3-13 TaxID=2053728 RepID=UPI000C75DA7D|nr:DUF986 family protein [Bacillus sp. V3-13]PLR76279.1 hypothetical protein CU633_16410 [Bacillus sp. V3-13]